VIEQVATDPAEQALAQLRVVIDPRHDHVGAEIGGARKRGPESARSSAAPGLG
jgi:hypothetical protein